MGIVFLGNPEKEKSWVWGLKIKGGNTWLSWVHVWGLKIRGGNTWLSWVHVWGLKIKGGNTQVYKKTQ